MNPIKKLKQMWKNRGNEIYIDELESDGVFNVYRFTKSPEMVIYMNVPRNLATIVIETDEKDDKGEPVFLSSERMEDWDRLNKKAKHWSEALRSIEMMYRNVIEDMAMQNAEDDEDWD